MRTESSLDLPLVGLAALFLGSGTLHLVRPQVFEPIVPSALPDARKVVEVSGVAEIVCGLGLLHPKTRRIAGLASAALLVVVFPANVQMSVDAGQRANRKRTPKSAGFFAGTLARLPLQWPMIKVALRAGKGTGA
ncbi:DoxX family protein [Nocardioides albus]|uniref:Putative membrane protein n=1 Tax=Nocardioides albus TaxID=1841 RepID=A0A7W5AAB8_9ACTN|nr:DoxX family protein [Nocardioides albus]MBB3092299.1 putative membrane protein [Nocardioides albus]GGU26440.1 membrane protein [Nocardioides albus]